MAFHVNDQKETNVSQNQFPGPAQTIAPAETKKIK